jgi:hypothetical protein
VQVGDCEERLTWGGTRKSRECSLQRGAKDSPGKERDIVPFQDDRLRSRGLPREPNGM